MKRKLEEIFKGKKILVTGGTGYIGSEIVRRLSAYHPKVIRILSNDEDNAHRMMNELSQLDNIQLLIGDIRDKKRMLLATEEIDIIYHAAALKHVPLCEYNPFEAIQTNVLGTQNIIEAALANDVKQVINISTDKAVNPVNTMGATKLLAERLITNANRCAGKTILSSVRFGNVLFSRGSVLPLFEEQIRLKKPVTITVPEMTRFTMSIADTVNLVFKATMRAKGGEIFILKMPVMTLGDLADVAIDKYAKKYGFKREQISTKIIGTRPGEKIFEELMTEPESELSFETKDMLIIPPHVLPKIRYEVTDYEGAKKSKLRYVSQDMKPLSKKEIEKLLNPKKQ